jgi:hypothetical protein
MMMEGGTVNGPAGRDKVAAGEGFRRAFLAQVIGGCAAFLATLLGIPGIGFT